MARKEYDSIHKPLYDAIDAMLPGDPPLRWKHETLDGLRRSLARKYSSGKLWTRFHKDEIWIVKLT